jgi:Thrombospondin type 3 repeat
LAGLSVSDGRVNAAQSLALVPNDTDGDGVAPPSDRCPEDPKRISAPCAPDADGDGVADTADRCPNEKGLAPTGCIGVREDQDGDGKPDRFDSCPDVAGTLSNGCPLTPTPTPTSTPTPEPTVTPPADRDGDGRIDVLDACPTEPAATRDGCPVPKVRSLAVKVTSKRKHRIQVRVQADRAATVTMKIERRVCNRKGRKCKWRTAASDATSSRSGRATFSRRLARGRYRVSIRLSSNAGQSAPKRKSFRL